MVGIDYFHILLLLGDQTVVAVVVAATLLLLFRLDLHDDSFFHDRVVADRHVVGVVVDDDDSDDHDDLVAVVGKSILPRPQVTQALWKYIRENDLKVGSELDRSLIATLFIARFILTLQHVSRSSFLPSLRTPKTNERSCAMKNSSVSLEGIQVLPCFQ